MMVIGSSRRRQARDRFPDEVTGHRMRVQLRCAELDAASRLADIRRQITGPPPPRPCDRITPPPAPVPAWQHWYWDDSAGSWSPHPPASWTTPAPSVVWRPRRSVFGWLRLMWVGSWLILAAYGFVAAALVELVEAIR